MMKNLICGAVGIALVATCTTARAEDWQQMAMALVACAGYQGAMANWERPFDAREAEARRQLSVQFTRAAWIARVLYLVETGGVENTATYNTAKDWALSRSSDMTRRYARALREEGDAAPRFTDTEKGCGVLLSYTFHLKRQFLDE